MRRSLVVIDGGLAGRVRRCGGARERWWLANLGRRRPARGSVIGLNLPLVSFGTRLAMSTPRWERASSETLRVPWCCGTRTNPRRGVTRCVVRNGRCSTASLPRISRRCSRRQGSRTNRDSDCRSMSRRNSVSTCAAGSLASASPASRARPAVERSSYPFRASVGVAAVHAGRVACATLLPSWSTACFRRFR